MAEPVQLIFSSTNAICWGDNGTITLGATGGAGSVSFAWSSENSFTEFALSGGTYSVSPGSYVVGAQDSNGCESFGSVDILGTLFACFLKRSMINAIR